MIINNNDGKPIGFLETLISNERVITVNATQHATTITTRDRNNGQIKTETFYGASLLVPKGPMNCQWLFLASPQVCGKPGNPYCAEHQGVLDYIHRLVDDWDEILATHEALYEEPEEEQQLCTVCNHRPVHDACTTATNAAPMIRWEF